MPRVAAALAWFAGLGFGVPAVFGIRYFAQHDEVWTFLGFPTYGGGPFEGWGIHTSVPLLFGFVLVCAAELAVGLALWTGGVGGLWMALALLPVELFYWIGFALPIGLLFGVARTILVVLALAQR